MVTAKARWEALRVVADRQPDDRICEALDYAEGNAQDTIYLEKAAPPEAYWDLAFGSIESTSPFCEHAEVRKWFAKALSH